MIGAPGPGHWQAPCLLGWDAPHCQAHLRRAQPTYLFSWRPDCTLGAWKTLGGEERAAKVRDFSTQNPSPLSPHYPQPRPRSPPRQAAALLADRQRGAALSAHSGPGCCLPAPAALLTHLGTWVALLPRGAGLSLGTLQETQAGIERGCGHRVLWSAGGKPDPGPPAGVGEGTATQGGLETGASRKKILIS